MLETITGSKLRAKVLAWLFTHPDQHYFVRQLSGLLEEDSTNISRELIRLEKTGILLSTKEGRQKYYRVNNNSPVYYELHGLVVKTTGLADVLRAALQPAREQIKLAIIFGSMASSHEGEASDIDVMIIGSISFEEAVSLLSPAEEKLGREINAVVYPLSEFRIKFKEGHHFIRTVIEDTKIFLVGDESELGRLVA